MAPVDTLGNHDAFFELHTSSGSGLRDPKTEPDRQAIHRLHADCMRWGVKSTAHRRGTGFRSGVICAQRDSASECGATEKRRIVDGGNDGVFLIGNGGDRGIKPVADHGRHDRCTGGSVADIKITPVVIGADQFALPTLRNLHFLNLRRTFNDELGGPFSLFFIRRF